MSAKLAVTGASTTVEVTGSAEVAASSTPRTRPYRTVINSKQMVELPTLTRNPYDLVATSGNVTEDQQAAVAAPVMPLTASVRSEPTSCWTVAKTLTCLPRP